MTTEEAAKVVLHRARRRELAVYMWLFVVSVLVGLAIYSVYQQGLHQKANRVANVKTWCSSINQGRDDGRRRAEIAQRHNPTIYVAPYTLADLDCGKLERQTKASAGSFPW